MRILVIGVRSSQLAQLRRQYSEVVINGVTDSSNHKLKVKNPERYDLIVSVTKFTQHSTENYYSKLRSFNRISGGMSSLIILLNQKILNK